VLVIESAARPDKNLEERPLALAGRIALFTFC
jgi:hypothetical protein